MWFIPLTASTCESGFGLLLDKLIVCDSPGMQKSCRHGSVLDSACAGQGDIGAERRGGEESCGVCPPSLFRFGAFLNGFVSLAGSRQPGWQSSLWSALLRTAIASGSSYGCKGDVSKIARLCVSDRVSPGSGRARGNCVIARAHGCDSRFLCGRFSCSLGQTMWPCGCSRRVTRA